MFLKLVFDISVGSLSNIVFNLFRWRLLYSV